MYIYICMYIYTHICSTSGLRWLASPIRSLQKQRARQCSMSTAAARKDMGQAGQGCRTPKNWNMDFDLYIV